MILYYMVCKVYKWILTIEVTLKTLMLEELKYENVFKLIEVTLKNLMLWGLKYKNVLKVKAVVKREGGRIW